MSTTKRYDGAPLAPDTYIAPETDPWLQDAATGERVNLQPFTPTSPRETNAGECECAASAILPGIFAPCNDDYGIETHDECATFPGDLEAAAALAAYLSETTGRRLEVWFEEARRPRAR